MSARCRACLSTTAEEYIDVQSTLRDDCTYLEYLQQIAQIEASADDALPQVMCNLCVFDVQTAFDFALVVKHADAVLRAELKTNEQEAKREEIESLHFVDDDGDLEGMTTMGECVLEEVLETEDTNENGTTHVEIMEVEAIEEHILEEVLEEEQMPCETAVHLEEKSQEGQLLVELAHAAAKQENLSAVSRTEEYFSEDELDDEYLIEYTNNAKSEANPAVGKQTGPRWKCVECKRVLRGDVSYEGHMNMHKQLRPYKCTYCRCSFRCKAALERHKGARHPKHFICEFCAKGFRLQTHMEQHKLAEHNWLCTKCSKTFDSQTDIEVHEVFEHDTVNPIGTQCPHCSALPPMPRAKLLEHYRLSHPSEYRKHFPANGGTMEATPWRCNICKRCFRSESALRTHRNTHVSGRAHACQLCGKRFTTAHNLRGHQRSAHTQQDSTDPAPAEAEQPVVQCEICRKQLLPKNLSKHMALHERKGRATNNDNDNQTKYLCAYCPRECKNQKSLHQHEKMHKGESPDVVYLCTDCDRHYATQHLLLQHRKQAHKERDNICPICGNAFKLKNQLMNHMKLHLEKNIQCPECDKKYARQFDLNVHMRSHTGELPYACHLCEKRFAIKVRLTYHLQKHYGIKHRCKECGAEFNSKQKLRAHSYKHSGMPYRCEMCDDHGFANRNVFKRHLLRVHNSNMSDEALVEMFQRNTGKTTLIRQINETDFVQTSDVGEELPEGEGEDSSLLGGTDIAIETEVEHA